MNLNCLTKYIAIIGFISLGINSFAQNESSQFYLLNETDLQSLKTSYQAKDAASVKSVNSIINLANKALKNPDYSVTYDKENIPPSGDLHDYTSYSRYYWSGSTGSSDDNSDNDKYIRRDGQANPDRFKMKDHQAMYGMANDVKNLSLAYYFTGSNNYVNKAKELLAVWFINADTKMNPNLNYAQMTPDKNQGKSGGIIDSRILATLPDYINILQMSGQLDNTFITSIKQWYKDYTNWLLNSSLGQKEGQATNNHGAYYDLQLAVYSAFSGDLDRARNIISKNVTQRIQQAFMPDGSQPEELKRANSMNYTVFNLKAFTQLAILSQNIQGVNLWTYQTNDGRGLKQAFNWFKPYVQNQKQWQYKQLDKSYNFRGLGSLYKAASRAYNDNSMLMNLPAASLIIDSNDGDDNGPN